MMQDKSVWFGTRDDMVQVKCPSTGLTRVPTSWRTNGTFLSGGGYARSSGTAHTDASISWGGDSVDDFATLLTQLNKDEPLHYLDPLSAKTNVLPPYAAQYTRNNPQGATEAARAGGNGYPAKAAHYETETKIGSAFVPQGYNLWVGGHGMGSVRVDNGFPTPPPEVQRTNAANNPRFTNTSGTVEVRRNLFNNPRATSVAGWAAGGGVSWTIKKLSGIADHPCGITTALRGTVNTSPTVIIGGSYFGLSATNIPLTPGKDYSFSWWVRPSIDQVIRPNIEWKDSSGAALSSTAGVAKSCPANVWTSLSAVGTAVDQAAYANVTSYAYGSAGGVIWPVGSTLDATGALAEATTILRPYFDGSYSPDPDLTPVWVGTENASQSYLRGFVPGNTSFAGPVYRISSQNGLRLIPYGTSTDTSTIVGGSFDGLSGQGITFVPGKWYGVSADCILLAPQTSFETTISRRISINCNNVSGWGNYKEIVSSNAPNEVGTHHLEMVGQLPADSIWAVLRLYNGASFGGGDVYWDKLLIVEGDTEADVRDKLAKGYFDGSTDNILNSDGTQIAYTWRGNANGSPSDESLVAASPTVNALPVTSPVRVSSKFTGTGTFYDIYASAGSTLNGVIAQVLPDSDSPKPGGFVPGMGFSALRLKEDPQITEYSAVLENYQMAMTANFTEVGSWES